mmetsp:Transcript_15832/g.32434  ORF Transcript_15832/g.32434 Transcript_15832/m.32434 type:complete len:564 (-) Transcript_15832:88-1779(-)
MSNWMTSGSARLKAKQNSSFSRRARQRAAVVALDSAALQGTEPVKSFPRTRPRRNGVKRRYSYGNPIARRGVVVSIGSAAATCNPHRGDEPIESSFSLDIITQGNHPDLNQRYCPLSEAHVSRNPEYVVPRRRIRDANTRYRRLYSNKNIYMTQRTRSRNYHHSQHTVSHMQSPIQRHRTSYESSSLSRQRYPPFHMRNTNNGVYDDMAQNVPKHFSDPHVLEKESRSMKLIGESLPPRKSECYEFEHKLTTFREQQQQETFGVNIYGNAQLASRNDQPHLNGIQRFQKRVEDLAQVAEGDEIDSLNRSNHDPPGDTSKYALDDDFEPPFEQSKSGVSATFDSDRSHWNEPDINGTFLEQPYQKTMALPLQSNATISESSLTRRMSDITSESNSLGGSHPLSNSFLNHGGVNRFKRIRREDTNCMPCESSFGTRHLQSNEMILDQAAFSDGFNSLYTCSILPECNGDQSKSTIESLKFFDNGNEVDFSGNLLNVSTSISTNREVQENKFATQQIEQIASTTSEHYGRESFDKPEWQQKVGTSPDTDFLRDTSFGVDSIWTFFR